MTFGLLFDIDGTLVTFSFDVKGSRKVLIEELSKAGFDISTLSLRSPTQQVLDTVRSQIVSGRVKTDYNSFRSRLYSILDEFEAEGDKGAVIFPDTVETLKKLRNMSVKLAVLTNSGRKAARRLLEGNSLDGFFEFILTRDDVDAMKPNPEGVAYAVSKLSLPKERVYYVGDSLYDITAAKMAGLKVVSVATGNYTAEMLRSEGADIVIDSLSGLIGVLPL